MTGETVLVSGCEYTGGLATLRGLRAAGYRPWAAVTTDESYGAVSRAAAGVVHTADPRIDPKGFVNDLVEAAVRTTAKVVLPGTEAALIAVSEHVEMFPPHVAVGAPDLPAVLAATDKTALSDLASAAGFRVPPTRLVDVNDPIAVEDLSFPAVVKPLRSEQHTTSGLQHFEVSRVDTLQELEAALKAMPDGRGLVQPYLAGPIRTVNGVAWRGDVVVSVHKLASRTWPAEGGVVCNATTTEVHPALDLSCRRLMRDLGWSGLFNLQLIETSDGVHHLIDINPRMYHSLALAIYAGANLPAIWVDLLLDREPQVHDYLRGAHFRAEEDFYHLAQALARHPRAALGNLAALLPRRRTVHPVVTLGDPRPALVMARRIAGKLRAGVR